MRSVRGLRPALALALALLAAPALAAGPGHRYGGPTCHEEGQIIGHDGWTEIRSPKNTDAEGGTGIVGFDAPEHQKDWMYITNGRIVKLSLDGGCTWAHIFPNPDPTGAPADGTNAATGEKVAFVAAPSGKAAWVVTNTEGANGVSHPHVYLSRNATPATGNSKAIVEFEQVDVGLPPTGKPLAFVVPPGQIRTAYLLLDGPPDPAAAPDTTPTHHLYALSLQDQLDRVGLPGLTWAEATLPPGMPHVSGLSINPLSAKTIWAWSGKSFALSTSGGSPPKSGNAAAWVSGTIEGTITALDADEYGVASVYYESGQGRLTVHTLDPKQITETVRSPGRGRITAATHGQTYGVYAVSGPDGTYGYDLNHQTWVQLGPHGMSLSWMRIVDSAAGRVLFGQAKGFLFRYDLYAGEAFMPPPPPLEGLGDPNRIRDVPKGLGAPLLLVDNKIAHAEVTVQPGTPATVPVDLLAPPHPAPLDVYFLVDTTTSMAPAINALKASTKNIADTLQAATHNQACFGVGEVKDRVNADTIAIDPTSNQAYIRRLPIADVGGNCASLDQVNDALGKLKDNGGGDPPEAQTVGLVQAVTGEGAADLGVLADQDAKFRGGLKPASFKVIVLITDAQFHQGSANGYNYPTIPETVAKLNSKEVRVVTIVMKGGNTGGARHDAEQVAQGTNTLAPATGVDCDGDGKIGVDDVKPHKPLVCVVTPVTTSTERTAPTIEPAIVDMLLGVRDDGPLDVAVHDPDRVVTKVDGQTSAPFNRKYPSHLRFKTVVDCTTAQDGKDLPVFFDGSVDGLPVGSGVLMVHCRAPKVPKPPVPPPPVIEDPVVHLVVLPVVPEVQVPAPNTGPGNLYPNAGFSHQEEQQFQLATVTQQDSEEVDPAEASEDIDLAMSGLNHDDPAARMALGCAGLVTVAGATGLAYRRRLQRSLRPSYARIRR